MNALTEHPHAERTTCPYCGVGCGLLAKPDGRGGAAIAGDPDHPANFGRLCSKGSALGETLGLEGRLLHPLARQADEALERISWNVALDRVASGFINTIAQHGPQAVAFYLSGQLLTEDYYIANKLMKGFIGTANVDTNSRLCMASSVAGHRRVFGADTVPCTYEDIDLADLVILVGSNAAWCHPVLFQRMMSNKLKRGAKTIVIDPRRTESAEDCDLFLPIAPGMDVALFSGLFVHLVENNALDRNYIESNTVGFAEALARAREIAPNLEATARATGIDLADVARFFDLFRTTEKVLTCFSQGVNQSAQGTDKVASIINCHLITGRIGRPGMGPFSLTGQPNAMGGREVGGMSNQLAAHMNFTPADIDRVGRFWRAPNMAQREGHQAVQMFEAIERGEIKALWVMATNPAVSLPRARAMREALRKLDLFVVSENVISNDTTNAGAHVLLPAAAWGEKSGTVTNTERRISRQRAFMPTPGESKPDWWIVAQVARRMGFGDAFAYRSAADIFREHAALSTFENDGERDFDIGALATLTDEAFDALAPVQWPCRVGIENSEQRFFAHGDFFTADRKARLISPEWPAPREAVTPDFPFRLNTGRVRDQWHTMTRSGSSPRLAAHTPSPFVEVHPLDAAKAGLVHDSFARVSSPHGSCVLKVVVSDGQKRGSLFAPIHWSDETAWFARVGELVAPATDPYSGQPESKATRAAIAPLTFAYRGFALSQERFTFPPGTWWSKMAVANGNGYMMATNYGPAFWREHVLAQFGAGAELAEYFDEPRGSFRVAAFADRRLIGCLFIGSASAMPQLEAVKTLFGARTLNEVQRRAILSGKSIDGMPDPGPLICACFGVGLNTIRHALENGGAVSIDDIGAVLRAGTNCGSCLPELKRIVADGRVAQTLAPIG
jgi:assimilatory nitrate reductase catalytic subunit